jgi:hypothetical protein
VPVVDRDRLQDNLFDRELTWIVAQQVCREVGAQGLVTLEAFDTEVFRDIERSVEEKENEEGRDVRTVTYKAIMEARVMAAWRIYHVEKETMLDDLPDHIFEGYWEADGETRDDAADDLPADDTSIMQLSEELGVDYGVRIAPSWIWVTRQYYGGGHPQLSKAKQLVKVGDWAAAEGIWLKLSEDSNSKFRGRAEFNMALAQEKDGRIRKAISWAKKAEITLDNGKSRDYVVVLERRLEERKRLRKQMREPRSKRENPSNFPDDD